MFLEICCEGSRCLWTILGFPLLKQNELGSLTRGTTGRKTCLRSRVSGYTKLARNHTVFREYINRSIYETTTADHSLTSISLFDDMHSQPSFVILLNRNNANCLRRPDQASDKISRLYWTIAVLRRVLNHTIELKGQNTSIGWYWS